MVRYTASIPRRLSILREPTESCPVTNTSARHATCRARTRRARREAATRCSRVSPRHRWCHRRRRSLGPVCQTPRASCRYPRPHSLPILPTFAVCSGRGHSKTRRRSLRSLEPRARSLTWSSTTFLRRPSQARWRASSRRRARRSGTYVRRHQPPGTAAEGGLVSPALRPLGACCVRCVCRRCQPSRAKARLLRRTAAASAPAQGAVCLVRADRRGRRPCHHRPRASRPAAGGSVLSRWWAALARSRWQAGTRARARCSVARVPCRPARPSWPRRLMPTLRGACRTCAPRLTVRRCRPAGSVAASHRARPCTIRNTAPAPPRPHPHCTRILTAPASPPRPHHRARINTAPASPRLPAGPPFGLLHPSYEWPRAPLQSDRLLVTALAARLGGRVRDAWSGASASARHAGRGGGGARDN